MNNKKVTTDWINPLWKPAPMFYGFKPNVRPYILPRNRGKLPMPKSGHIYFKEVAALDKAEFNPLPNRPELQLPGKIFYTMPQQSQKFLNAGTVKLINSGKVKAQFKNDQKVNPLSIPIVSQMANNNLKLISLEMIKNAVIGLKLDPALGTEQQQLQAKSSYDNLIVAYTALVDRKQDNPENVKKIVAQYEKEMIAIYGPSIKKKVAEDTLNEILLRIQQSTNTLVELYEMIDSKKIGLPQVEQKEQGAEEGDEGEGEGEGVLLQPDEFGQAEEDPTEEGFDLPEPTIAGDDEEIASRWYNANIGNLKRANFDTLYEGFTRAMSREEIENIIVQCLRKLSGPQQKILYRATVSYKEDDNSYDLRRTEDVETLWENMNNLVIQPAIELNYNAQAQAFGSQVSVSGSSLKSSKKEERKDEPEAPEPQTIAYKWYQKYKKQGFKVKGIFDNLYELFPNVPMNKDTIKEIVNQCLSRLTPDEMKELYYANVDDKQPYNLDEEDDMEAFVKNLDEYVIKPAVDLNDTSHAMRYAQTKEIKKQYYGKKLIKGIKKRSQKKQVVEQLKANASRNKELAGRVIEKLKANVASKKAKVKAEEEAKAEEPQVQAKAEEPKKAEVKADEALMKQRLIATLGVLGSDKGQIKQDLITMFRQAENPNQALTFYFDNLAARRAEKKPLDDSVKRMLRKTLVNMNKLSENVYNRKLQVPKDVNDKSLSYADFPATLQTAREEATTLLDAEIKAAQAPQAGPGRKRKSRKRPSKKSVKKMSAKINKEIFRLLRS